MTVIDTGVTQFLSQRPNASGHLGSVEILPIAELHIDPSYQRQLQQALVDQIALNYDPLTAGFVLVSRRESGDLYIVDGQHKTVGAQHAGQAEMLCLVIDGLTPDEEARLRLAANVKRTDSALEKFKARLVALDPVALAINRIVESFDVKINLSAPASEYGINGIAALERVFRMDGNGALLITVLKTIQDAWGKPESEKASVNNLKAIAFFYEKHEGEFDRDRLVERLAVTGPAALRRMGMNSKAAMGGSQWLNHYRSIVEVYNYRLSSGKLEWKTVGWTKRGLGYDGGSE